MKPKTYITEIEYRGIKLVVEGTFTRGEQRTYDYPGTPDEFEAHSAYCNGVDITELFDMLDDWKTLEELVIETI